MENDVTSLSIKIVSSFSNSPLRILLIWHIQVKEVAIKLQLLGSFGYDSNYGARPVKRVISQNVENKLAKEGVEHVNLDSDDDHILYRHSSLPSTLQNHRSLHGGSIIVDDGRSFVDGDGRVLLREALVDATSSDSSLKEETGVRMVALFDHEECGSDSAQGAGSPVVLNALSRITNSFSSDPKAGLALGELQSIGDLYDFNSVATLFLIGVVSVMPLLIFSALDALPTI
ncbi:hypothetical protein RIF29_19374 [Crotalaria pallida]|uniref:Clp ATPase C-terminal domain-containing protein n=1 Tax=Crotalaria pallida TaxID=3830 RepID=A0AAN9I434_CROPI